MDYQQFLSEIFKFTRNREDLVFETCGILKYKKEDKEEKYDFIKIQSKEIKPEDKILLIRAGIHGDEIAGPLTLMNHLGEIFDYAHKNNVKLIIYPVGNPSGFENGLRYNIENDKGPAGNNDFMRYELEDGKTIDELGAGQNFKKWYWASDPELNIRLPKETVLMHRELKKCPLNQIIGVIDLHQDYLTLNIPAASYHYSFGDLGVYKSIVKKLEQIAPILRDTDINAGFQARIDESGRVISSNSRAVKTDSNGFIVRHDCTLPDLMYRLGTKYCVTVETTGATPKDIADKVNLTWIQGLIDLIK